MLPQLPFAETPPPREEREGAGWGDQGLTGGPVPTYTPPEH